MHETDSVLIAKDSLMAPTQNGLQSMAEATEPQGHCKANYKGSGAGSVLTSSASLSHRNNKQFFYIP